LRFASKPIAMLKISRAQKGMTFAICSIQLFGSD
jgi:hypothetical protein